MVYFRTSDIASLTGYNKYKETSEAIKELLEEQLLGRGRRNDMLKIRKNVTNREIINVMKTNIVDNTKLELTLNDLEIKLDKERDIKIDEVKDIINSNVIDNRSDITLEKIGDVCENINKIVKSKKLKTKVDLIKEKSVSDDTKIRLIQSVTEDVINKKHNRVKDNVSSFVVKRYGTVNELSAIQLYEKENNCKIYGNNAKLYKQQINNFSICGKVDGFVKIGEEEYLIEVKNRQNRFFRDIPIYEKVQIMIYMFLTGTKKAIHIQKYNGSIKHEIFDTIDHIIWNNVIERLGIITNFIEEYKKKDNLDILLKNGKIDINVINDAFGW